MSAPGQGLSGLDERPGPRLVRSRKRSGLAPTMPIGMLASMRRRPPYRTPWRFRKAVAAPSLILALLLAAPHAPAAGTEATAVFAAVARHAPSLLRTPAAETEATVVFAAASTMAPMNKLAAMHERGRERRIRISFAASASLARQVLNGAQPGLFLSANRRWMDALEDAGLVVDRSRRTLLANRLIVIRRKQTGRTPSLSLARPAPLLAALGDQPLMLGDPSHVPAGIYAREALRQLGLWEALRGRLAFAANARAVTVRVARGEAPLGITYASELKGEPRIEAAATFPEQAHAPIRYELALVMPETDPEAAAFFDFLLGDTAAGVFRAHGFIPTSAPAGK